MLLYAFVAAAFSMTTVAYDSLFILQDASSPYQSQDCKLYRNYSCSYPVALKSVTYSFSFWIESVLPYTLKAVQTTVTALWAQVRAYP